MIIRRVRTGMQDGRCCIELFVDGELAHFWIDDDYTGERLYHLLAGIEHSQQVVA